MKYLIAACILVMISFVSYEMGTIVGQNEQMASDLAMQTKINKLKTIQYAGTAASEDPTDLDSGWVKFFNDLDNFNDFVR